MAKTVFQTKEPVVLEGYQAVLKPSQYGYSLSTVLDEEMIEKLEANREEALEWAKSKLKNPKRATLRPEPWEEVSEGKYKVKFSWNEETKPPVVDTEGTPVTDENTPVYSGAQVKVAFYQKPYLLKDGVTYGTSLKCLGIQLVSLTSSAGVDSGDMSVEDVAALFGTTKGYKQGEASVVTDPGEDAADF